jgi:serine/threonine protein kinase
VLVDNGVALLCDFGLLRLVHDSAPTGMTTTSSHTGTTRYLSYELVSRKDDDAEEPDDEKSENTKPTTASDVYALACIGVQVSVSSVYLRISPSNSISSFTRGPRTQTLSIREHILRLE